MLSGALLVGDPVRGSLRDLTLERLGAIDQALLSEGFFTEELAARVEEAAPGVAAVPAILLQGGVVAPELGTRSSMVNVQGIDERFASLYDGDAGAGLMLDRAEGQTFPSVIVNEALRAELGAEVGTQVLVQLARPSDVPRESLMGSSDEADVVQRLRLQVRAVIPDRGPGRFGLAPQQSLPGWRRHRCGCGDPPPR